VVALLLACPVCPPTQGTALSCALLIFIACSAILILVGYKHDDYNAWEMYLAKTNQT